MFFGRRKHETPQQDQALADMHARAGKALVTADDAVRSADEELSFAQAQFGLSATDDFAAALTTAREHVARSFELRKLLDDDIPETPQQQWQMCQEIIGRCTEAINGLQAQQRTLASRRSVESDLPATIVEVRQRAEETQLRITTASTLLVTLHATYPASALTSVSEAPERAGRLLEAGRTALDQAQASADAGHHPTAVEQVRIARGAITQADELINQVSGARERLERSATDLQTAIASISSDLVDARRLADQIPIAALAPLVSDAEAAITEGRRASGLSADGDPLAALDHLARAEAALDAALAPARAKEDNDNRARASLGPRLARLNDQIAATTSYITTNRGAVGTEARTALSEASRHASTASALQATDLSGALAEVAAGEPLATQAQRLAEGDVSASGGWMSPGSQQYGGYGYDGDYRGGRRGGLLGGLDAGSLVLGGLIGGALSSAFSGPDLDDFDFFD